jgi:Flp pilus assembly protein TadD
MAILLALALGLFASPDLYEQGSALFRSGRFAEAAAVFEKAVNASPKDARLWKAVGASYAAMADYERANEPFSRACSLDPSLEDACYYYGCNLYALNRFEPAIGPLRQALRIQKRPWRVHLTLAQSSEALGRVEEAEAQFLKSISIYQKLSSGERGNPDFDPRLHYGVFLFRHARLDDAISSIQVVTQDWPAFARGHYELGRLLEHTGKLNEARQEMERAVQGGFGGPAHLLLGRLYLRLGQPEEAQKHLRLAEPAQ